jgi:tetratricopeptide (TPR) repeat protein
VTAALALALWLAAPLAPPGFEPDVRKGLDAVYALLAERKTDEAKAEWNRIAPRLQESLRAPASEAERQARSAEAMFALGLLSARTGEKAEALELLKKADGYGFPPLDSPLLLVSADALADLGETGLALTAYREYLKRRPGDTAARLRLSLALYSAGRFAGAEKELADVLRRTPRNPQASYLMGAVLLEQKRVVEGKRHLERALAADPRCAPCLARLAHAAYLEGDDARCEAMATKAAAIDPGLVETSLVLGMLENRRGRYEQAIAQLTRVVERLPELPAARHQLAIAYRRSGQPDKAREQQEVYDRLLREQDARNLGVRGTEE